MTRGEAQGHDMWLDMPFLNSVRDEIKSSANGIKARFTHPDLSGDGLGKFLGRFKSSVKIGDRVFADLHFSPMAHETPDGNLAQYVMGLAESDPEAFGTSIVFSHDPVAELDHAENKRPDDDNERELLHARLAVLHATDVVDEPAANPNGLFHRRNELFDDAEAVLEYAYGIREEMPVLAQLDVHPERVVAWLRRFLDSHGLRLPPELAIAMDGQTDADESESVPDEPFSGNEELKKLLDSQREDALK